MKFNCCNKAWDMIRAAFDMASHSIRGIRLNTGTTIYRPDGAGTVDIPVLTQTDLDGKQNKLTAGIGITISNDVIRNTSRFTVQNNDGSVMFYQNGEKVGEITEGANITISPEGVISATGGGSGGTSTASEVLLTDGRSVQEGIDALEDELGDLGTSGTVQERLEALEQADVELSKAYSGFSTSVSSNELKLTMDAVDGMTSATGTLLKAGTNITLGSDGTISASGGGSGGIEEISTIEDFMNIPNGKFVLVSDPSQSFGYIGKILKGSTTTYVTGIGLYARYICGSMNCNGTNYQVSYYSSYGETGTVSVSLGSGSSMKTFVLN